jgi:FG-GAP repeat protein/VCBS repeat protein
MRRIRIALPLLIVTGVLLFGSQRAHGNDVPTRSSRFSPTGPSWRAECNQVDASFGQAVSTAGDVNGDGYDDVIVGAPLYDHGQVTEGRAIVYYGSASGPSRTPAWTAEGDQQPAMFGYSVSTAGDVNGDGYDDVIVGAYQYSNGETLEGRAYVYHGSPSGLPTTPNWIDEGDQSLAGYGISVDTAGDVNGDGYDDVIVAAYAYDDDQVDEGRAFVYQGSPSGLSTTPAWTGESNQTSAWVFSVGGAGDVNGDGYDDVILGSIYFDHGQHDEGRAFVYHGSGSGLSSTPDWTAEGDQTTATFGNSVGTAGDVNGDGYADVIVGANFYDNGQADSGRSFAYHGSPSGLATNPSWTARNPGAVDQFGHSVSTAGDVNGDGYDDAIVGALYGERAFVFLGSESGLSIAPGYAPRGEQAEAQLGFSVGTAGDVDADGLADVIVGAPNYDHGQEDEGIALVYRGRPTI